MAFELGKKVSTKQKNKNNVAEIKKEQNGTVCTYIKPEYSSTTKSTLRHDIKYKKLTLARRARGSRVVYIQRRTYTTCVCVCVSMILLCNVICVSRADYRKTFDIFRC